MNGRRLFDGGLLAALALALLAASPFLARPGLPRDTDAELHVFRAAEVLACWQAGVLYPRWAPDFYYGYGYPIFNYYAPLTYHLSSLLALLPGVGIVGGVKGVFVLGLVLGGVGAWLLARDLAGSAAGVVGAAAFLFSPYVLFINPHARGDLAEHFAVGLLPPTLFFLQRLIKKGGWRALAGSAISIAALVLSHNLLGGVGLGVLLVVLLWQGAVEGRWDGVGRGALGLGLGLALSSFFWLPMLAELDAVHLSVVGAGHFDFRNHFVPLGELLAPSRIMDLGAVAPRYRFNLGLGQWVLALVGIGAVFVRRQTSNVNRQTSDVNKCRTSGLWAALGMGLVFLITPASRFVWEAIQPLAYLQFPWRLLGPTALALAVCAAAGVTVLPPPRWRPAVAGGMTLVLLLLALPTMFPLPWGPDFGDTSPVGIIRFELEGKVVGTTSTGDFLPRIVETGLHPEPSLIASYEGPGPVDKVNRATLPEGTEVRVLEHGPTLDRFHVTGEHNFVFRLYTLLFPGWHAYVDGQEVEIEPGLPEGFITFWVSRGEHEVVVRFEDTLPRRIGWWLSAAGAVGLLTASAMVRSPARKEMGTGVSRLEMAWIGGAIVSFFLFKFLLVDPHPAWFRYTSPTGEAWAAQHVQRATLGGEVEFLGFDLPRRRVRSGEELMVVLYWRALKPLETNYQSFVHLTYPPAISWGQSDALNPGGLPTTRWPLDRYVWDLHRVRVRPGTPPGEYRLEVGLYTMSDGRRLAVAGPDGASVGESVVLEVPVEVLPAARPPTVVGLEMDGEVGAAYAGQVKLLGYAGPEGETRAPGFLHLTLFWQAVRDHPDDLVVSVAVVDGEGEVVALASGPPAVGRYPTGRWRRGEIVRDPYAFWLGPDFEPGIYTVGVVVHRGDRPLTPEGMEDPFLKLFDVEVRR